MLRYLRMDLYRLVKGKMLWVMMGIVLAMSVMMAFMMWLTTTPEFAQSVTGSASIHIGISDGSSEPVDIQDIQGLSDSVIADFTQNQSTMWLGGGAMAVFVAMMVALFFALDFTTGYVKNLPSARRDRLAYYGEKLVFVVLLSAALFAFGIATFELARMAAGFSYGHVGTFGEVAAWFGSAVVVLSAYGAVTAVVAWLTQNKTAAIATALVTSPRLIIADEPTTALDSITQRQIVDLLTSLVDESGASMLFITHDFAVLNRATTRCYVLENGRIEESGDTTALLDHPHTDAGHRLVQSARALSLHAGQDVGQKPVRNPMHKEVDHD